MDEVIHNLINKLAAARLKREQIQEEEDKILTEIMIYIEEKYGNPISIN